MTPRVGARTRDVIDAEIEAALDRLCRRKNTSPTATAMLDAMRRAAVGGKRFRPRLVGAAFEAFGGTRATPALGQVAAAYELLHTAFVVHDDVIDHDTARRGVPNVQGEIAARARNAGVEPTGANLLGQSAAILAGDLFLHESARLIALAELPPARRRTLMDIFDEAILISAVGELADVENAVTHSPTGALRAGDLIATAHDKTAVYSFSAPLRAGAVLADAPEGALEALRACGSSLGLAFQLVDDLIGAFGTSAQAGKETGADLREAKQTPLIAIARQTATWSRVDAALALAHTGPIAVREAQRAIDESGAREELVRVVHETLRLARSEAESVDLPPAASALLSELADAIGARIP